MKHLICLITGLLIAFSAISKSRVRPAELVEQAKREGRSFISIDKLLEKRRGSADLPPDALRRGTTFDFHRENARQLLASGAEYVELRLPTPEGGTMDLELVRVNLFTPDFLLRTERGGGGMAYVGGLHYRGVVKGKSGSIAALSIFEDEIMGICATRESGNHILGKMEGEGARHVLYRELDLLAAMPFHCETEEDDTPIPLSTGSQERSSTNPCIRVYLEVDEDLRIYEGGVTQAADFATGLFNQVSAIFAAEDLDYVLSEIFVQPGASPYPPGSPRQILDAFQAQLGAFNGDFGHLINKRQNGGSAAGQNGLCNPDTDHSLCVSNLDPYFNTVPTYSWSVNVMAHEMGHLNGSPHTHSCAWNGNGTAIDGCADTTSGGCPIPGYPVGGGTIMSYCHNKSVGINFALGFGQQPGDRIRNVAAGASCLSACTSPPPPQGVCQSVIDQFPYLESFETGLGDWQDVQGDDFDWTRKQGGTPSGSTGPNGASDGSWYLFTEASNPNNPSKLAALEGPCFDLVGQTSATLEFRAHLYGQQMGTLEILASTDKGLTWASIWSRSGDQGNVWLDESVNLSAYLGDTVKLRIEGTTGWGYKSDMAIDRIRLSNGVNPPPPDWCQGVLLTNQYAGFEQGWDQWKNVEGDDFDWGRFHESADLLTGPYPNGTPGGNYFLAAEADAPNNPSKIAYLESPCFLASGIMPLYFDFIYHMHGTDIGTLELQYTTSDNGPWLNAWTWNGVKDVKWQSASVNLSALANDSLRLRFKATTGTGPIANIALDNFDISTLNQDFENGILAAERKFTLFPNPVGDELTVDLGTEAKGLAKLHLMDLVGRRLRTVEWDAGSVARKRLDLNGLPNGSYLVEVEMGNERWMRKVVKQ